MYSNCLIKALKAKAKDPKNVVLHMIPAKINKGTKLPHFWWTNGDKAYDFRKNKGCGVLFEGYVRDADWGIYEARVISLYRKFLAKKFQKKGLDLFGDVTWHSGYEEMIDANYYYVSYIEEGKIKVAYIKKEDLNKYEIFNWMQGDDNASRNLLMNGDI